MQQETLLFIEPVITPWTEKLVKAAKKLGYYTVLIKHEQDKSPYQRKFDRIYNTSSWHLTPLRAMRNTLAKDYPIKALMSGHGLFTRDTLHGETVALLAQEMGLKYQNIDALYRSNNKYLMRDAISTAGLTNVDFQLVDLKNLKDEFFSSINYPCILKPTHLCLSSFISKCNNAEELCASIEYSVRMMPSVCDGTFLNTHTWTNKSGQSFTFKDFSLLVEDYIPGIEGSIECIATDDQVIPLIIHEKVLITEKAHTVHENLEISPPLHFSQEDCEHITHYTKSCVEALGITNSLIHVEFRYSKTLGTRILEINPRVGGGISIDRSIREFTGLDPATVLIEIMTGQFRAKENYPVKQGLQIGMFSLFPEQDGVLKKISGVEEILNSKRVEELDVTMPIGANIRCKNNEVFLVNGFFYPKNEEDLFTTYEHVKSKVVFEIE